MSHQCRSARQSFALFISGYNCPLSCVQERPYYSHLIREGVEPNQVREALTREIAEQGLDHLTDAMLDELVNKLVAMRRGDYIRQNRLLSELATKGAKTVLQIKQPQKTFNLVVRQASS